MTIVTLTFIITCLLIFSSKQRTDDVLLGLETDIFYIMLRGFSLLQIIP